MKYSLVLLLSIALYASAFAQTTLHGTVTEAETGEAIIFGSVAIYQEGVLIAGTETDFDGNYSIVLDAGSYDIEAAYVGLQTSRIKQVIVLTGKANRLDIQLESGLDLQEIVVVDYKIPLISQDNCHSGHVVSPNQIRSLPSKNINGLAAATAGVDASHQKNKPLLSIRGSRASPSDYYVDGIRARGTTVETKDQYYRQSPSDFVLDAELNNDHYFFTGTPAQFEHPEDAQDRIAQIEAYNLRLKKQRQREQIPAVRPSHYKPNTEDYAPLIENEFESPKYKPLSTFSIDVDNASYSNIRRYINQGNLPPKYAVRSEEMINYFDYDYPYPEEEHPFAIHTEIAECPWQGDDVLLHIGLQGEELELEDAPANNLVFLIDVSGSMDSHNKLELLKPAFKLLVRKLRPQDHVAIVVYAGAAGLVLPSTSAREQRTILAALDNLRAGGSTAGGAGIQLAYKVAKENFTKKGNNRVILATDGDFNIGASSDAALEDLIAAKQKENIFLSVLGFGMGNYKDNKLEILADKGNGNYAYIDNLREAKKVFVTDLMGTLYTIAKDVKLQLEFNPKTVASYRLIGYENRLLLDQDFNDDTKDAGELGAGHTVTAIYQIVPKNAPETALSKNRTTDPLRYQEHKTKTSETLDSELVTIKLRYKRPKEFGSTLITQVVQNKYKALENSSDNFRFSAAVAGFSLLLRQSEYAGNWTYAKTIELAKTARGGDSFNYRNEFILLVEDCELMDYTSKKE